MSVVLVLAGSILYPALIFKLLSFIQRRRNLRMYWIIVPICLVISVSSPLLYSYIKSPTILFSLETMIDYTIKTGYMIFLVIPSLVTGIVCTVYGYMNINKWSISIMSTVIILGMVGLLFFNGLVNRFMYEPAIRWEQIPTDDIARAGMWVYDDAKTGDRFFIELNEQEANQVRFMFNSVPTDKVREVQNVDRNLIADIGISLKSNENVSIQVQYDKRDIYVEITNKRNQKEYFIESTEFRSFFDNKLKK